MGGKNRLTCNVTKTVPPLGIFAYCDMSLCFYYMYHSGVIDIIVTETKTIATGFTDIYIQPYV